MNEREIVREGERKRERGRERERQREREQESKREREKEKERIPQLIDEQGSALTAILIEPV